MSNALLCDVSRYAKRDYIQHVPQPTHAFEPGMDALTTATEEQMMRMLAVKEQVLHHNAGPHADADASTMRDDACNKAEAALESKQEHEGGFLINGQPPASQQELVNAFFMDGSAQLNGQTFSKYPIFGHRTAEERLAAVRSVLDSANAATHLPDPRVAEGETREQYWRRLARHYINVGAQNFMNHQRELRREGVDPTMQEEMDTHAPEDSFYMIDIGRVIEQMARWRHCLPMVRPHFAVKCNPNLRIMQTLAALGAGFDCASKAEIDMVLNNNLVETTDDIIFANPCKQLGDLRAANARGVQYVTFDNPTELQKIATHMPQAKAVIRIKTNDHAALFAFSRKFGAPMDEVENLLATARQLNVEIYGVSFHVGSGNSDTRAYVSAVRDAHWVFQQAAKHGFNCTLLDIGGGYPGTVPSADEIAHGAVPFEVIAAALRPVLEELFPDTTIISEPGRYFTAATHALAMNVFATRRLKMSDAEKEACREFQDVVSLDDAEEYQYYVNDGLYNTYNCIVFDSAHPALLLLDDADGADNHSGSSSDDDAGTIAVEHLTSPASVGSSNIVTGLEHLFMEDVATRRLYRAPRPLRLSTIFGPTCDSLDCILKKQPFPEMRPGDWLISPDMGSYTTAAGCAFNGFATRRREYVSSVLF